MTWIIKLFLRNDTINKYPLIMLKKHKLPLVALAIIVIGFIVFIILQYSNLSLLNPKGPIARAERDLAFVAVFLMLIVAVPMTASTFIIAYRYRAGNKNTKHEPDKQAGKMRVISWWAIPTVIVLILGFIIWKDTHKLDQYRPIESSVQPITIQVVALRWKWLFIYPKHGIATVNFIQFPEKTPINFELTADEAPMNSLWIPALGGQTYAMTGMSTKLHLMADNPGDFRGSAAELSGSGFSGMKFIARSSTQKDFEAWVQKIKQSSKVLDSAEYERLILPSENNSTSYYSSTEGDLYNKIITKYMAGMNH